MFSTVKRIHFIGIGGIGMSGIAEILLNQGFEISGSDMALSPITDNLEKLGAKIFKGHKASNIEDAEVVVYSSAVKINENPETKEAIKRKIPLIKRAVMLAEATRMNYCLAIAGTHGKTTTTSIVGLILIKAGIDPTVIVGGRLRDFGGTNARLGNGDWTVVEADEYDRSFLQLSPAISIINNHQYANGASIYTQNGYWSRKFKLEAECGMIGVNIGIPAPVAYLPFGGLKESQFADIKAQGKAIIDFYSEPKVITERFWEEED